MILPSRYFSFYSNHKISLFRDITSQDDSSRQNLPTWWKTSGYALVPYPSILDRLLQSFNLHFLDCIEMARFDPIIVVGLDTKACKRHLIIQAIPATKITHSTSFFVFFSLLSQIYKNCEMVSQTQWQNCENKSKYRFLLRSLLWQLLWHGGWWGLSMSYLSAHLLLNLFFCIIYSNSYEVFGTEDRFVIIS